ncbi:MAG: 5-oxoprolinase (ATP-hydrolyzing) subunit [Frankiaceae bacterium]|nr:5-oxoprolinase (ATP-hydrolyzing) subunit [Frankiaceae bacterium]
MVIDLNADLGEGFGPWRLTDDEALLDVVTSANVACGFHAGDPSTMSRVAELAAARGVRVGAQVGYRDLVGFGRRDLDVSAADLTADIRYQIGALAGFAEVVYIKPHGALYNRVVHDELQAGAVVTAAQRAGLPLLGLPGSVALEKAAATGVRVVREGFPDREYDGPRLRPRSQPGAVIDDPQEVARRAVAMARSGDVDSLCVHGDTPGAVHIAVAVRAALNAAGVELAPFA